MEKEKKNEFHLPEYYENRELSWLKFDARVLNEAKDKRTWTNSSWSGSRR